MRTMYDALNPLNIPTDAKMVASYIDAGGAPPKGWEKRFPNATIVKIVRIPTTNDGHVIDIERGAATIADAVQWVQMRRAHGANPSVYTFQANWPSVRMAFQGLHIPEPPYWIAAWNDDPRLLPGAYAHQYINDVALRTGYDLSVVADFWPGVDDVQPHPLPPPPPPLTEDEDDMLLLRSEPNEQGSGGIGVVIGNHFVHLTNPKSADAIKSAGVPLADVAGPDYAAIATALGAPNSGN